MLRRHRVLPILIVFATFPLFAVSFSAKSQSGQTTPWHADFNNDGREDWIAPAPGGLTVQLSNGGGTYNAPKFYALPGGNTMHGVAIGQFCCSGDFVAIDFLTPNLFVFAGNGSGGFTMSQKPTPNGEIPLVITAGDFNHDGAMDIAYEFQDSSGNTFVQVLFGPMLSGDFTFGPTTLVPDFEPGRILFVGDFDGDGKADLLSSDFGEQGAGNLVVYYGDGAGNFPVWKLAASSGSSGRVFDVNGDGKSDIIVHAIGFGSSSGDFLTQNLDIYYGNAARTWTVTHLPTAHFTTDDANTAVADFNGDGIPDLAYTEAATSFAQSSPRYLVVRTGKGGGAFNSEVTLTTFSSSDFSSGFGAWGLDVVRSVRNNKPNIGVTLCESATSCSSPRLWSYLNTTSSSGFPTCTAPNGFQGISVCALAASSSVNSPVRFSVGAVTQTFARKVEVWIDGHKVGEQFAHDFSHYAFMNKSFSVSAGTHKVSVFAAGWDNWLEKKSFTITVP
jgi:hypothetical protein